MMRRILLIVLTSIVLAALSEALSALWLRQFDLPLAAYVHAPYDVATFRAERNALYYSWTFDGQFWRTTFHSKTINVVNGLRVVTGPAPVSGPTLWLAGDSTVFDAAVPDGYTKADALQALWGQSYRVVNLGVEAMPTHAVLPWLQTFDIRRGDVVALLSGDNDYPSVRQADLRAFSGAGQLCTMLQRFKTLTTTALCLYADNYPPAVTMPLDQVSSAAIQYRDDIATLHTYVHQRGAAFYAFLGPSIWSQPLNDGERAMAVNPHILPPYSASVYAQGWPAIQQAARQAGVVDLTHILDSARSNGTAIYLDCCHINDVGNAIVARAIYDAIFPVF